MVVLNVNHCKIAHLVPANIFYIIINALTIAHNIFLEINKILFVNPAIQLANHAQDH